MIYRIHIGSTGTRLLHTKRQWLGIHFLVFSLLFIGGCSTEASKPRTFTVTPVYKTGRQVNLSLRVLVREAEAALASSRPLPEEVENLAGIGWLEGFVIDTENADVILIGRRSENWPSLHLDDLVVNLRNVWRGNIYPYCSLDPRPEDIVKVNHLFSGGVNVENFGQMHQLFSQLRSIWGPQVVVVGGVPKDSRHAHVMIDADYHMKKVSQGLVQVNGITSYIDTALNEAKKSVRTGLAVPASRMSMARFWFHVGKEEPTFTESEGIRCLEKCSIVVLTEKQRATTDGILYDSGGEDPYAGAFAEEFSECFAQAATTEPAYADLENLFRLNALLQAMHLCNAAQKAGLDLQFYLRQYEYQIETTMPPTMPGLVHYKEAQESLTRGNFVYKFVFFPMVCGGVSMEIDVSLRQFRKDNTGRLDQLRSAVIKARPSPDSLYWLVPES